MSICKQSLINYVKTFETAQGMSWKFILMNIWMRYIMLNI